MRPTVDIHRPSDDGPSCKQGLPQLVRENRDRRRQRAGPISSLFLGETSSLRWLDAKRVEQIRIDGDGPDAARSIASRDVYFSG